MTVCAEQSQHGSVACGKPLDEVYVRGGRGAASRTRARHGSDVAAVLVLGGLSGVAIGEGIHGLTALSDTTSPVFWWIEVVLGVAALVVWGWIARPPRAAAVANVLAVVVAASFAVVYRGA